MSLRLLRDPEAFRGACDEVRRRGARLGLVPTMGALHAGHLSLVEWARQLTDAVAVTIFVNPAQFGPGEDLDRYPRTLDADLEACDAAGVSLAFAPERDAMYPPGDQTRVRVGALSQGLCGASRPHHFEGVTTVVAKLFALSGACTAVFGRKDYQQLKVIERMTRDLMFPVSLVGAATVREADGLALSSRNRYLDQAERACALAIPRALSRAVQAFQAGERGANALRAPLLQALREAGLRVDYATLADADTLDPVADAAQLPERALVAIAAHVGATRLIDNVVLGEDPAPLPEPP